MNDDQNFYDHEFDELVASLEPEPLGPAPMPAPLDGHGDPYTFELIYDGGNSRTYAHQLSDLLEALVPGYGQLDAAQQWHARLRLAIDQQTLMQALLAVAYDFNDCSPAARAIVGGGRAHQPQVDTWDEPVPLILIETYYEPAGQLPRPRPLDGRDPNVIWIDPSDSESLLLSLHGCGAVTINVRKDHVDALP